MKARATCVMLGLVLSANAFADRGALTVDIAGGGSAASVPALMSSTPASPPSTVSFDVSGWLGVRYALKNTVELSMTGFFEPPATVYQNDIRLVADSGTYPGTTRHELIRFGAQAGVRLVLGMRFRVHVGLEFGWCQQLYSQLRHFDVLGSSGAVDYGLTLSDASLANLVASPLLGVEWAVGDQWSVSLMPRAQMMLGNAISWAVVVPLQFSWSWYL